METLKEALVKKNQRLKRSNTTVSKRNLKSGYTVVRYRNGKLAMYLEADDIEQYPYLLDTILNLQDIFVYSEGKYGKYKYMPLDIYDDNLKRTGRLSPISSSYDVVDVYFTDEPREIWTQHELEDLIKNIKSIKINQ